MNLTRACLGIRHDMLESIAHGLKFHRAQDILACSAEVSSNGTFAEYLKIAGTTPKKGMRISLDDCLARIIEISEDYHTAALKPGFVCPVAIEADHSGRMSLNFHEKVVEEGRFRTHWELDYPSLVPFCELESSGCILTVKQKMKPNTLEEVSSLCEKMLDIDLIYRMEPIWFAVRHENLDLVWPRPAYYFAALFILGNIVRYEPELMFRVTSAHSKWAWMLQRFISAAERFYPNLMLNRVYDTVVFFGRW